MQTQRVETKMAIGKGSDGELYDLHQISHQSRPKALGESAPWSTTMIEWFLSDGRELETEDERIFMVLGGDLTIVVE